VLYEVSDFVLSMFFLNFVQWFGYSHNYLTFPISDLKAWSY